MTTNSAPNLDTPEPDQDLDDAPSLRRLAREAWQDGIDRDLLVPAGIAAGALCGLVTLVLLVRAAIHAGADTIVLELARTVTVPVEGYLTSHGTGLPVSPAALMVGWYVAGGALLLLSGAVAARGARVGWVLFGLATAAMVYAGTPHPRQWIAVGIAAAWWTLLSIPALARRPADCRHQLYLHTDDQHSDDQA